MATTGVEIGERLKLFRLSRGWGPAELAQRANVSRNTIHRIESGGATNPRARSLHQLALALGTSVVNLAGSGGKLAEDLLIEQAQAEQAALVNLQPSPPDRALA